MQGLPRGTKESPRERPLQQGQLGNRAEASALLHTPLAGHWLQATLTRRHFHFQQPSCPSVCSRRQPQEPEWARLLPRTPVAWAHLPLPGSSGLGTTATVASDPTGHTLEAARGAGCRRAQGPRQGSPGRHHEPYSLGRHPWAAPSVGCSYWLVCRTAGKQPTALGMERPVVNRPLLLPQECFQQALSL